MNSTQGFTLLELLIVIAVIGVLSVIFIPNLLGAQKRAFDTAAVGCANEIKMKQGMYLIDNRTYAELSQLSGMYAIGCDADVTIVQIIPSTGTSYAFSTKHANGIRTYTISNTGLTIN